jgi:hypothetical protein
MKFVHDNHKHFYRLSGGMYGYTLKSYNDKGVPVTTLPMNDQEVSKFKETLKKGGWYESAAR